MANRGNFDNFVDVMERPVVNLVNAGLIFMHTVWLQGQMSDLVILKKNPGLIGDFTANPARLPSEFFRQRAAYWERHFGDIKNEFVVVFSSELVETELQDLDHLWHVRNMIGHAHISLGRDYMLYRPAGERKEKAVVDSLKPQQGEDQSDPLMIKLEFWKLDVFQQLSDLVERLDQVCFSRLAQGLGVPHGRIR